MTRCTSHHAHPLGLTVLIAFSALVLPLSARAQIASPFNAGANSGNNSLGSSSTSIGTPDFTRRLESLSQDVTVQQDGSLITSPQKQREIEAIIRSTSSSTLAHIVDLLYMSAESGIASLSLAQGLLPAGDNPQLLDPATNLANQLVASGVKPPYANQLVSLLVGLSQQPNLNQLSDAINLFNHVIRVSSPEVLNSLRINPGFLAISEILRSARTVLGS